MRVRAARLLDQQLWCLGWDIRRGGNLLVQYGLVREEDPSGGPARRYSAGVGPGRQVVLWGFGAAWHQAGQGTVFLRRHGFTPRWSAQTGDGWTPEWFGTWRGPREAPARVWSRVADLARWMADYELWVLRAAGLPHRAAALATWHKKASVSAEQQAEAWLDLAAACWPSPPSPRDLVTTPMLRSHAI